MGLRRGCSIEEVIGHFMSRSESPDKEKSDFAKNIEKLIEGKDLSVDDVLQLIEDQLDDESQRQIKAMLEKGYSKQDVINHLLKNQKTSEEKERENARKLMSLFDDQEMSEQEKIMMLEKQLNNEDKAQMEEMLRRGCSIEEVIGHFMSRSESPDKEKSDFAKNIEKLIEGKELSVDDVLQLIEDQLDDESKKKMEEMLQKGYTKQDVVNRFMKNAKTKEEQMRETADKIKALMNDENMSEENKLEILRNQLSKEDLAQMEKMLKSGCSMQEVIDHFVNRGNESDTEEKTEFQAKMEEMMEGNLSNSEVLGLIKGQLDEQDRAEM